MSGCRPRTQWYVSGKTSWQGLDSVRPTVEQILHTVAAAKRLDALEDNLLLAPIQSSVVPLPHSYMR
ncbi:MAG: hypothetical protein WDM70_05195 [Nitrosomonadales bacterium]